MRLFPPRQRRRALTTLLAVVLTAAVAAPAAGAAPADAASADGGSPAGTTCRVVEVPVRAGLQSGPVSGTLCTPPGATSVQLLVAGWTYNRHYWETAPNRAAGVTSKRRTPAGTRRSPSTGSARVRRCTR